MLPNFFRSARTPVGAGGPIRSVRTSGRNRGPAGRADGMPGLRHGAGSTLAWPSCSGTDSGAMSDEFEPALVVGHGAVGGMVKRLLESDGCRTDAVDLRSGTDVTLPPTGEYASLLAEAKLVVLSLPESVSRAALGHVLAAAPQALIVDTDSVKSGLSRVWSEAPAGRPPVVSINPMFAPSLGTDGQACLVVDPDESPVGAALVARLERWGMRPVRVDNVVEHDRLCATVQGAVHATILSFGVAMASSSVPIEQVLAIAPPPCRTLFRLVARMTAGAPEVYEDIQAANPLAGQARAGLVDAVASVNTLASTAGGTASVLEDLRTWLGHFQQPLAEECATMFAAVTDPQQ